MKADRISLSYVVHCLLEDENFKSDAAKPPIDYEFPAKTDFFEPLIQALQSGEITAQGTFARVRLDYPEFEGSVSNAQLSLLATDYRRRHDIIIGIGAEAASSDILWPSWRYERAIWEKSILWVADPEAFEESRWRGLKIERTVPFPPERSYGFEELICFLDVRLNLSEVRVWADTNALQFAKKKTEKTGRKTGPKPKENWEAIEEYLVKEIEAGREWVDWNAVWHSLLHLRSKKTPKKATTQPYKKLEKRLRDNNPEFLGALRGRIETSRTKK